MEKPVGIGEDTAPRGHASQQGFAVSRAPCGIHGVGKALGVLSGSTAASLGTVLAHLGSSAQRVQPYLKSFSDIREGLRKTTQED